MDITASNRDLVSLVHHVMVCIHTRLSEQHTCVMATLTLENARCFNLAFRIRCLTTLIKELSFTLSYTKKAFKLRCQYYIFFKNA